MMFLHRLRLQTINIILLCSLNLLRVFTSLALHLSMNCVFPEKTYLKNRLFQKGWQRYANPSLLQLISEEKIQNSSICSLLPTSAQRALKGLQFIPFPFGRQSRLLRPCRRIKHLITTSRRFQYRTQLFFFR